MPHIPKCPARDFGRIGGCRCCIYTGGGPGEICVSKVLLWEGSLKICIIDDEPGWRDYISNLVRSTNGYRLVDDNADLYIVSDRKLDRIVPGKSIVFTSQLMTTRGEVAAYRAGALDYQAKDFRARLQDIISKSKSAGPRTGASG